MRAAAVSSVAFGAFMAGLAVPGCGGRYATLPGDGGTDGGGSGGLMGATAGSAVMPLPTTTAGSSSTASGGTAGPTTGGVAGSSSRAGSSGLAGSSASGGAGGAGGFVAVDPLIKVVPSQGCGVVATQTPGVAMPETIPTSGVKAPDCADKTVEGVPVCGPWSLLREYDVILPLGYDNTRPYPLVIQGPGCGGKGNNGYPLADFSNIGAPGPGHDNVDNTVIRVGLTPPPISIGHATNPGQGCFDESEGDDSVEWPFYENLYDRLQGQLCFDKNRVFANGNGSGGGRFVDELACKYAGDVKRPIRGVISNSGDWATSVLDGTLVVDPRYAPTCTTKPMAGMWVHEIGDPTRLWNSTKLAIARAMKVDGCTIGTTYDEAKLENFPIGGDNPDNTCQRMLGCSELTPLVVCLIQGNQHGSHDKIVNPGASTFIKLFERPPLAP